MTLHLTRYFGVHFETMPDAIGRRYLVGVLWYSLDGRALRYRWGSVRWFR